MMTTDLTRRVFLGGLLSVTAPLPSSGEFVPLMLDGPQLSSTDFIIGAGDWSIDFWVNVNRDDDDATLLDEFAVRAASNKRIPGDFYTLVDQVVDCEKKHVPRDGGWHHYCVTSDGVTIRRYLDGRLFRETPTPQPLEVRLGGAQLMIDGTGDYVATS
jgi:hypothetical protein